MNMNKLLEKTVDEVDSFMRRTTPLDRAKRVLDLEIESLQVLRRRIGKEFNYAIELMLQTLERKNKFIVTGVGKSGHIGNKIAATLTSTGAPAIWLDPMNAVHGDMGVIAPGDLIIILSYSGETDEILRILPSIARMQVKMIALTGDAESAVAREADIHLNLFVQQEACPLNLAPTSSTTCMLALGDALAMALLEERGFQKEDFAKYHPGGAIGRNLLLKVEDVMRPLEEVAVCEESDTVTTGLTRMTKKRCGAVIVIKPDSTLAGIYTHGDFVRSFQRDSQNIGSALLKDVMIVNPIAVQVDRLAVQVLNTFEKYNIQDLIVLDANKRPVGLVDIQDLTKQNLM